MAVEKTSEFSEVKWQDMSKEECQKWINREVKKIKASAKANHQLSPQEVIRLQYLSALALQIQSWNLPKKKTSETTQKIHTNVQVNKNSQGSNVGTNFEYERKKTNPNGSNQTFKSNFNTSIDEKGKPYFEGSVGFDITF